MKPTLDEIRDDEGKLPFYTFPGCYPIIYWVSERSNLFPLCAKCVEGLGDDEELHDWESGDNYDHDLPCANCGKQLAAYFNEEG